MASSDSVKGILLPYQRAWVGDPSGRKIWLAARQVGKSFALSLEAVVEALSCKSTNLLLSGSQRQSHELMQKVYSHLRCLSVITPALTDASRMTSQEVELPGGSRIISLPANPDTVRGFSGNVYLDEFAFHSDADQIWRAMYPTVTRGYKVRVVSTPNGKQNLFHDLWTKGEGFTRHNVNIHDAAAQGMPVDVQGLERGIGDPIAWRQEYECEFVDEATALLPYGLIEGCSDGDLRAEFDPKAYEGECYLGVDVGRAHDLTVMWMLVKREGVLRTAVVQVMRQAAFSAQRDALYALLPHVRRAAIDATGIGAQLAEEAKEKFGHRVEQVVFTSQVKEDMALTLRRAFEERTISVPRDMEVRADLHAIKRMTTVAGNARFDADRTSLGHGDRFWALALALHVSRKPTAEVAYEQVAVRELGAIVRRGCW